MPVTCPVAQHRWFEDGEGWAFDRSLAGRMRPLAGVLDPELKRLVTPGEATPICYPAFSGWLVGERVADPTPPDPKAVARGGAFILRVALLRQPDPPDPTQQVDVRQLLRLLPPPPRGGQELAIELPDPPPVAEPEPEPETPASPAGPDGAVTAALLAAALGLIGQAYFADQMADGGRAVG